METHAHHLHNAPGKNFWHFFFEFLMLFIAVFCGFMAENIREHKVEEARGKQYIASLIEDLEADTSNLNAVIKEYDENELKIDTLLMMFGKFTTGYNDTLHRNFSAILRYPDFIYTDRTMQQLKNSGGMQLIRNKVVTDGIMGYDSKVRDCGIDEGSINQIHSRIRMLWYELIDTEKIELDRNSISISEMEQGSKNYLLVSDKATLGKFNNMIRDYKRISILVKKQEIKLKEKAVQLIALLKKEYNFN
jgi:hypothetical protein